MENENIIVAVALDVFFICCLIFAMSIPAFLGVFSLYWSEENHTEYDSGIAPDLFRVFAYVIWIIPFAAAWILFCPERKPESSFNPMV